MAFIVEMLRQSDNPKLRFFSCSDAGWKELHQIGRTFGWQPSGTEACLISLKETKDYTKHFKPDYEPEEWRYSKDVSEDDAKAWAEALGSALEAFRNNVRHIPFSRPTLLQDCLSAEELIRVNAPSTKLLTSFEKFLLGGRFSFAWDD